MAPMSFHSISLYVLTLLCISEGDRQFDESEIHGYHFHTYFLQNNAESVREALDFRSAIQHQIEREEGLTNCRLNHVNLGPRGPHPVGSYETCCNKTSVSKALSWFMLNHGNLSILLHPLTRYEVLDHSDRSMFLGQRYPLDLSVLSQDLEDHVDLCLPITIEQDLPPSTSNDLPIMANDVNENDFVKPSLTSN